MDNAEDAETALKVPSLGPEEAAAMETGGDSKAAKEERQFAEGKSVEEMSLEARRNEHGRTERFKDHFEKLAKIGLTIAFWAAVAFAAVWCWHVIMPSCLRWLEPEELDHLQNLIAGGVLASLASEHFRRRLN